MASRGVLMFAHNNQEIDYFKIAMVNAFMVQKNLNVPVTLITDEGTHEWALKSNDEELINKAFDNIVVVDKDYDFHRGNQRIYRDTNAKTAKLAFYNCNHWAAYELSPYDETLFIDSDYLIMSDALSNCWGSVHDFMISDNTQELLFTRQSMKEWIDPFSIRLYWATVVYFRKSAEAEAVFDMVKHVFDNYEFYNQQYNLPNRMFRNDWAFAIAVHQMNDFQDMTSVPRLPIPSLLKTFDSDELVDVNGVNDITFLMQKPNKTKEFLLSRLDNIDIHIMNKWSLLRHADKLIEVYNV
jgi:hypothetical protein